jgi:CheY-like chemotaxis protein
VRGAGLGEANMARILLADDDAATRALVQRALGVDGHDVAATQDGAEALEKLQAGNARFDVLITDVQMPGLDGVTLIERGLALHPKLRVVLMSGFADEIGRAAHLKPRTIHARADPLGGEGGAGMSGPWQLQLRTGSLGTNMGNGRVTAR